MSAQATGTDPGSKSSAEIEREVEQSRSDIEHTLDAIQDRLSPGQMLDKAMGVFRGGSGDFARNLGDSITANPIPLALIGVGVAWMMYSSQRPARPSYRAETGYWDEDLDEIEEYYAGFAEDEEHFAGYPGEEAYVSGETETSEGFGSHLKEAGRTAKSKMGAVGEQARHAGERVRHAGERARHAAERARRAGEHARERFGRAGEQARERFGRAGEQARERFGRARAGISESAHEAGERLRQQGYRATRGMRRTLDEQPLVLGAIGLAIGAALGAALPPTETEDELMGEARDKALRQATKAGREQADKMREAAGAVAAAAREEAGKQGLTPKRSGENEESSSGQQFAGGVGAQKHGQGSSAGGQSTSPGTPGAAPFPTDPQTGVDRS